MSRYFALHLQNFVGAAGRLARHPLGTLLTVLVIAIALALPTGLRVIVNNADTLSDSWQSVADITVFLHLGVDEERAAALANAIEARADVSSVQFITRDDALVEFREKSGFGDALDALEENPLPHTLIVRPESGLSADIDTLLAYLRGLEEAELVQIDTDWLERLRGMLALTQRVLDIASVVLGVAVLVVIGNTIRLEINNRSNEIEVMKLVGGSDGFIRRPFLYLGFWYGLLGSIVAALLIAGTLVLLRAPVASLAELYGSTFSLTGLSPRELLLLSGSGIFLGWAGAGLAAARHLRAIEPR